MMSNQAEKIIVTASNIDFKINHRMLLCAIDFEIRSKETLIITGPSGSGKTTLAKIIGGALIPTKGDIIYSNNLKIEMVLQQDQFVLASGLRTSYYGQRYENPNQEGIPTVSEYIQKASRNFQINWLDKWSDQLGIESLLQRKLLSLSNGERKRVQLAVALLKSPDLLILDQPFVGLDIQTREKLGCCFTKTKK